MIVLVTVGLRTLAATVDNDLALDGGSVVPVDVHFAGATSKASASIIDCLALCIGHCQGWLNSRSLKRDPCARSNLAFNSVLRETRSEVSKKLEITFSAGAAYQDKSDTKSGKRHHTAALLSWRSACDLGFRGTLGEWERLLGAQATAPPSASDHAVAAFVAGLEGVVAVPCQNRSGPQVVRGAIDRSLRR